MRTVIEQVYNARVPVTHTVLDLYCGTGMLSLAAAKAGFRDITCADISVERLRVLEDRVRRDGHAGNSFRTVQLDAFAQ